MTYLIEERTDNGWTYADLEGKPSPQTMRDVARVLRGCAANGADVIRVREVETGKDVTDAAVCEFACSWPSDMPEPDFLTDSFHGQQIMRGVA